MTGSYVLEIPDLHQVLNQEEATKWEIFLTNTEEGLEKISWPLSSAGNSVVFHNHLMLDKQIKSVEIDFTGNQVTFYKGHVDSHIFEEFLELILSKLFIHIHPDQMHFLVSPKKSSYQRSKSTRK